MIFDTSEAVLSTMSGRGSLGTRRARERKSSEGTMGDLSKISEARGNSPAPPSVAKTPKSSRTKQIQQEDARTPPGSDETAVDDDVQKPSLDHPALKYAQVLEDTCRSSCADRSER